MAADAAKGGSAALAAARPAAAACVQVVAAAPSDTAALFALVNAAYQVETGDTGVAFKNCNRLLDESEIAPSVLAGRCLKALLDGGELAGCICFEEVAHHGDPGTPTGAAGAASAAGAAHGATMHMHFGPFAVAVGAQGRGVGRALLEALYARARAHGIRFVDIVVVNHRSDIMPWYEKMHYIAFGEGPFPAPERLSRESSFVLMRLDLEREGAGGAGGDVK